MQTCFRILHTSVLIALLTCVVFSSKGQLANTGLNGPKSALLVIPQPKVLKARPGEFIFKAGAHWELLAPTEDQRISNSVQSLFGAKTTFKRNENPWYSLQLGRSKTTFPVGENKPKWATNSEGYSLKVQPKSISILASSAQGVFYGLQTLKQLARKTDSKLFCPAVEIEDWPVLAFRGTHWFPSASGFPMHQRLIRDVFGPLKFNNAVIQCEAASWDTHPEITARNAISKADLRKLVEQCRAQFIEPTPLLNVPGHAEWIFRHGKNLDFAEDPQKPYAYCVNNPKSIQFIQDILGECLPLFESSCCHIGHDEVTMRGRFPNPDCPYCKKSNVTALVIQHANQLNEILKQKGVKSMIWGDMLLGPGEAKDATHAKTVEDAKDRRSGISKDITIVDWHYAPKADATSLEILQKNGFPTIAGTWYGNDNIYNFTHAAIAANAKGLLQTTWMGYFPDEEALKSQLQQFTAFVLAAEYAWSGRQDPPSKLGYDPKEVFSKLYGRTSAQ